MCSAPSTVQLVLIWGEDDNALGFDFYTPPGVADILTPTPERSAAARGVRQQQA